VKRVSRWKDSVVSETPGKSRKIKTKSPQEDQLGGIRDSGDKLLSLKLGSQVAPVLKNPPAKCRRRRRYKRCRFSPWVGRVPRRRAWQPTPVFLPGESHGQRSLVGYGP